MFNNNPAGIPSMSLYNLQKILYQLNRDPQTQARFETDQDGVLSQYDLSDEERRALQQPDIGLLYVLGVNGQILMHYAAWHKMEWDDYLEAMREGLRVHGAVRDGVYAVTGYQGVAEHDSELRARRAKRR